MRCAQASARSSCTSYERFPSQNVVRTTCKLFQATVSNAASSSSGLETQLSGKTATRTPMSQLPIVAALLTSMRLTNENVEQLTTAAARLRRCEQSNGLELPKPRHLRFEDEKTERGLFGGSKRLDVDCCGWRATCFWGPTVLISGFSAARSGSTVALGSSTVAVQWLAVLHFFKKT